MASKSTPPSLTADLTSEFASVRVAVDCSGRSARLSVVDLETGEQIYLDALQLAAMCRADSNQQQQWLRTGEYSDAPR
jgi:hypothetical protein